MHTVFSFGATLAFALLSFGSPLKRAVFTEQNGIDAKNLAAQFASLTPSSPCNSGENACIQGMFAQCLDGKFVTFPCAAGLTCQVLPLVNSPGTSITCDTAQDAETRISNTGARSLQARVTAPPACAAKATSKRDVVPAVFKRIAQTDLGAVAQSWQNLCLQSGGDITTGNPCVTLAGVNGINSLLANADPCAQQDNADAMITFAKSPGVTNTQALTENAIAYRQHPRNALNINGVVPSTPFCQKAPQNSELNGVVNGQLDGVNPGLFGAPNIDIVAFGASGTCPFGQTPDVNTCTCN